MANRLRSFLPLIVGLALIAAGVATVPPRAQAQVCAPLLVQNNTACNLNLCLYDAAGNMQCIAVVAGAVGVIPSFYPLGAVSAGGTLYPFTPAPPAVGCTRCITLRGPLGLCCASVCFRVPSCIVTVNPCGPPCLP